MKDYRSVNKTLMVFSLLLFILFLKIFFNKKEKELTPAPTGVKALNTMCYLKYDSTRVVVIDTTRINGEFYYKVARKDNKGKMIFDYIPHELFLE